MLTEYCNQSLTLKSKSSVNEYNEPTYTASTILGRFEYNRKMVRSKTGEQVISEAQCYTKTAVKPDDVITFDGTDWVVISVANIVDLNGAISHYEVIL